jgi:hypothetical protein
MTLPELQSSLDSLGIELSARLDADALARLVVDAPAGVVTPEIRAALANHKPALMDILVNRSSEPDEILDAPIAGPPSWPPRPAELAGWPIARRERWGQLANELQDQGVHWPEDERLAFEKVKAEIGEQGVVDMSEAAPADSDAVAVGATVWDQSDQCPAGVEPQGPRDIRHCDQWLPGLSPSQLAQTMGNRKYPHEYASRNLEAP